MINLRLKPWILLFAALVLVHAQCVSACIIVSCQDHASPKSCHQTPAKQGSKACTHDSFASPAKAVNALTDAPSSGEFLDGFRAPMLVEPAAVAPVLLAPQVLLICFPVVLRI